MSVHFYTPVFRRDVLWYGDVRPGLRLSVHPSDSPSVRSPSAHFPHFSPTCFDILSWNFAHDFVLMYYRSSSTVVTLRQFLYACLQTWRIMVWWCPSGSPSIRPSDSPSVRSPSAHFPHYSPTCFDILSWNFAHDFNLMYYRSSLTVVTLRQFLKELCLFVNLE